MNPTAAALALALTAAVLHATWNLLAKRVGGGTAFIWLVAAAVLVLYAPAAGWVYFVQRPVVSTAGWLFVLLSGLIHLGYFHVLMRGYRDADLSVVYPLARGTGPLLSSTGAILLLGERPSVWGGLGILLVIGGVMLLAGGAQIHLADRRLRVGLLYGVVTGGCIALYTLVDKYAVSQLAVPPVWLDYGSTATRVVLLGPLAWRQKVEMRRLWRGHRFEILGIAFLSALAYILVLFALRHAPVSLVAPARESSIFFGTLFGAKLLAEGRAKQRVAASILIIGGIAFLAFG